MSTIRVVHISKYANCFIAQITVYFCAEHLLVSYYYYGVCVRLCTARESLYRSIHGSFPCNMFFGLKLRGMERFLDLLKFRKSDNRYLLPSHFNVSPPPVLFLNSSSKIKKHKNLGIPFNVM